MRGQRGISPRWIFSIGHHSFVSPQFIGETNNAKSVIGKAIFSTVNGVQVFVDCHRIVKGEHLPAFLSNCGEDTKIATWVTNVFCIRTVQNHASRIVITLGSGDVRMVIHELTYDPCFWKTKGIISGSILNPFWLPITGPVSVWVISTNAIFINSTIIVVIKSFLS